MKTPSEGVLLRIFIGESDVHKGRLVYGCIIEEVRSQGLAGATVLRGIMGYGAASRVHTAKLLRLSEDLPVLVEIVDTQENIDAFIPFLDDVVTEGRVTMERVHVIQYRSRNDLDG
jgi:hypothetical protein